MTPAIKAWVEKNKENFKDDSDRDHLIDFLMAEWGNKASINFSYSQCVEKAEAWIKLIQKERENLKSSGQTELLLSLPKEYKVVRLIDQSSKDWESLHMGNCVAVTHRDSKNIYSLRDEKNLPHVTMKINFLGKITEIRGTANLSVHLRYQEMILKLVKEKGFHFQKGLEESAGLIRVSDREAKILHKYFSNPVLNKIGQYTYLTKAYLEVKSGDVLKGVVPRPQEPDYETIKEEIWATIINKDCEQKFLEKLAVRCLSFELTDHWMSHHSRYQEEKLRLNKNIWYQQCLYNKFLDSDLSILIKKDFRRVVEFVGRFSVSDANLERLIKKCIKSDMKEAKKIITNSLSNTFDDPGHVFVPYKESFSDRSIASLRDTIARVFLAAFNENSPELNDFMLETYKELPKYYRIKILYKALGSNAPRDLVKKLDQAV